MLLSETQTKLTREPTSAEVLEKLQAVNKYTQQYNQQYYCPYCAPKCPCCGRPYSQPQYYPYYNTRGGSIGSAFNADAIRCTQHTQTGT